MPETIGAIRRRAEAPGDEVSCDQFVSGLPGRLPHTKGKERPSERYHGGTIFVDNFSSKVFIKCQVSLRTGETLQAKDAFESDALRHNVRIKSYRCDNHPFRSQEFMDDLEAKGQTATYCGVGAHHQNAIAERSIKTISQWSRAMMMNQLLYWP